MQNGEYKLFDGAAEDPDSRLEATLPSALHYNGAFENAFSG
jgi:hypothetical protein